AFPCFQHVGFLPSGGPVCTALSAGRKARKLPTGGWPREEVTTTMAIPDISDEQMRTALKELDHASYNHEQWAEALHATLVCRLTPDERDTGDDSHRLCRFGQWYYHAETAAFAHHPGFVTMGREHERMHRCAAALLRATAEGETVEIDAYERFVA